MSKSLGNVVDPLELKNIYGVDTFRYFLLRDMVFGLDSNFSEKALIQRINSDLANDLGNLFSRKLDHGPQVLKGDRPSRRSEPPESSLDLDVKADARKMVQEYEHSMEDFAFHKALMAVWGFV